MCPALWVSLRGLLVLLAACVFGCAIQRKGADRRRQQWRCQQTFPCFRIIPSPAGRGERAVLLHATLSGAPPLRPVSLRPLGPLPSAHGPPAVPSYNHAIHQLAGAS